MDNSTLNISIHICLYERRVDPKVPGSSPTVTRNVDVHYLLQSNNFITGNHNLFAYYF